jgi:hypothetical protein
MVECKDGRQRVVVQEHTKKSGTEVKSYIRSCPDIKDTAHEKGFICCVCGEEFGLDDIHQFEIKGQAKNICQGCADIVHGLM